MMSLRRAVIVIALVVLELALGAAWAAGAPLFLVALVQLMLLVGYGLIAGVVAWRAARRTYRRNVHEAAVLAERSRLAAEMHDLLGHRLSLLALRAGALQLQTEGAAQRMAAELRAGVDSAIAELAATIAVLGEPHPPGPPTAHLLTHMVARARSAGMTITLIGDLDEELPAGPRQVALAAIREGLTNAARHAPGQPVTLEAAVHDGVLIVRMSNPTTTATPAAGSGTGLVTLQRRIGALGGHLNPCPGANHFTFVATLPLTPVSPVTPSDGRIPTPMTIFIRAARAPVLVAVATVIGFYVWASTGATMEPAQFAAFRAGQPARAMPSREAPVRLFPTPPAPAGSHCRQYTDGSFPLAYATFQICVTAGTVTSATDLRRGPLR